MKDFEDFVTLVLVNLQDEIGKHAAEASDDIFQQLDVNSIHPELLHIMATTNLASNVGSLQISLELLRAYHEWANK